MKERGIIFSGDMPVAVLEDRKTQTRRLTGLQKINEDPDKYDAAAIDQNGFAHFCYDKGPMVTEEYRCPYGQIGDRLWVRETIRECTIGSDSPHVAGYASSMEDKGLGIRDLRFAPVEAQVNRPDGKLAEGEDLYERSVRTIEQTFPSAESAWEQFTNEKP